jgi:NADH-quinone oxidoreductase subunit J
VTSTAEAAGFWLLAPVAVIAALGLLFAKKAVHAALGMALVMCILGVFYIMQKADFLGIVQVFVYTGAVMMLFLFVLMLIGVDSSDSIVETIKGQRWAAFLLVIGLAGLLVFSLGQVVIEESTVQAGMDKLEAANADTGNVTGLAELIFGQYVWIFEVTSALLITAALGAMVLAHRERLVPRRTQAEWAAKRVRDNEHVAGLPAPGVYARHNAVDTPALLPDGTPSELSVSRVLVARDQVATADGFRDVERHMEKEIEEGRSK